MVAELLAIPPLGEVAELVPADGDVYPHRDSHITITNTLTETEIVAALATYICPFMVLLTNSDAAATIVTLRDAPGGRIRAVFAVPPTDMRGFTVHPDGAMVQTQPRRAWTVQCSVAVTSLDVTVCYVQREQPVI